jgi:hypothetical protein
MALMQKMTLGQAAKPGDGKLGRFIKKKVSTFKMKQAQKKLEDRKSKLESGEVGINRGNRNAVEKVVGLSSSKMNQSEQAPTRMGTTAKEKTPSRQPGERKYGKYANPLLYKMETVGRNIKDRFEQAGMKVKENKGRKRGMADAAGPTERNRDVQVCGAKDKNCQK